MGKYDMAKIGYMLVFMAVVLLVIFVVALTNGTIHHVPAESIGMAP
jgi:hypothetical protein